MNLKSFYSKLARLCAIFVLALLPAVRPVSSAPFQQDSPDTPAQQQYATWPPRPMQTLEQNGSAQNPAELAKIQLTYGACGYGNFGKPEFVTRLVFTSFNPQETQWDIYQTDLCSTTNPVRLTSTTADDVYPRFNADASWIVFVSDRTGNDEIFKMRANGSELTQLTGISAIDTQPAFSPDGSQVAFVSDRANGNADIYIMSSSGGAPRRLTTSASPDVEPEWSPDGKKIAWIRRSGSLGYLYVMNADGTGVEMLLASLVLGGRPSWSPDGTEIAFEYDNTFTGGNGWLDLGKINVDGTGLMCIKSGGYDIDLIMGSWYGVPDTKGFVYSKVYYEYYRQWYITKATPQYNRLYDDYGGDMESVNLQFVYYPHARTWDVTPPEVRINPLPEYSQNPLKVTFTIKDASVTNYSFEVKLENEAEWHETWYGGQYDPALQQEFQRTFEFTQTPDKKYMIRIKATDRGNNSNVPTGSAVVSTKIYNWHAQALVQDNRKTLLNGAEINAGALAFDQPVRTRDGRVDLYYRNQAIQNQSATIAKPGFGTLPYPSWPVGSESQFLAVLPPKENLVANSYFEDPAGALTGWQTEGTLPVFTPAGRYGGSGARLGLECFTGLCFAPAEKFPATVEGTLALAFDAQGGLHHMAGTRYFYRRPAGQWEERASLTTGYGYVQNGGQLPFGFLPDGRPFFQLNAGEKVFALMTASGEWEYRVITYSDLPFIAKADTFGQVHILYQEYYAIKYIKRLANGEWQSPITLMTIPPTWYDIRLAVGSDGILHVVFHDVQARSGTVSYLRISPDGTVSPVESIGGSDIPTSPMEYWIELLMDSNGILHLFADGGEQFHFWSRSANGVWSERQTEAAPLLGNSSALQKGLVGPDGSLHFYFRSSNQQGDMEFQDVVKKPGVSGLRVNRYLTGLRYVTCDSALDDSGLLHIVWKNGSSSNYQRQQVNTEPAQVSINQSVSLPSDIHAPTLSFFYRLDEAASNDQQDFRVRLTPQNGSQVTVYEAKARTETKAWQHAWVDLSAWKGQTVKLAFAIEQFPGENEANLYLDEVTVGAWTTPTFTGFTPHKIDWPVGDDTWIEISGENLMDGVQVWFGDQPAAECVWVSSILVRCRPDSTLPHGLYTLRLENPGGVTADSTSRLIVGSAVFLPTIRR